MLIRYKIHERYGARAAPVKKPPQDKKEPEPTKVTPEDEEGKIGDAGLDTLKK